MENYASRPSTGFALRNLGSALRSGQQRLVTSTILILAAVHCGLSIFFTNYSYLDLRAYAMGTERLPFQARVGMIPVLRAAGGSRSFVLGANALARYFETHHPHSPFREITAESLACIIAGVVCVVGMTVVMAEYGRRRFAELWWLPAALMLVQLYITQAARYEADLWYPYDAPHYLLFGIAAIYLLEGRLGWAFLFFCIDLPIRETAIFLAVVALATNWRRDRRDTILYVSASAILWVSWRLYLHHLFLHNKTAMGAFSLRMILKPYDWPQIASAFGFLLIPILQNRKRLRREERAFLAGMTPCLIVTLYFGVWAETRIFNEWVMPFAVLAASEVAAYFGSKVAEEARDLRSTV